MMRIGIISDTHRFTKAIDHAIPYLQDCDLIVHAGDNIDDADYIEAVREVLSPTRTKRGRLGVSINSLLVVASPSNVPISIPFV